MTLMDKLKFWKKEEEAPPDLPSPPEMGGPPEAMPPPSLDVMGMPRPMPGVTEPPGAAPTPPTGGPFAAQPEIPKPEAFAQAAAPADQQFQLISSKLDTIKAQLETILQRLDRLEQKNGQSPYQQRWRTNI